MIKAPKTVCQKVIVTMNAYLPIREFSCDQACSKEPMNFRPTATSKSRIQYQWKANEHKLSARKPRTDSSPVYEIGGVGR